MKLDYPEKQKDEILYNEFLEALLSTDNYLDQLQIRTAGRFVWERLEMGGFEYVQFAYKYGTPIVPPDHCGHPINLLKRGWKPKEIEDVSFNIYRWPDGNHFYAKISCYKDVNKRFFEEIDVQEKNGNVKWDTYELAHLACIEYCERKKIKI